VYVILNKDRILKKLSYKKIFFTKEHLQNELFNY
jgi:hypothetical protein